MSIRAVLCINRREYRVLRYRQQFAQRVSSNGMPASDLYGGTIDVEFELHLCKSISLEKTLEQIKQISPENIQLLASQLFNNKDFTVLKYK